MCSMTCFYIPAMFCAFYITAPHLEHGENYLKGEQTTLHNWNVKRETGGMMRVPTNGVLRNVLVMFRIKVLKKKIVIHIGES